MLSLRGPFVPLGTIERHPVVQRRISRCVYGPGMPLLLYSSGIDMEPLPGTIVEANLIKPYYNRGWDVEYAFYYNPPDKATNKPAITITGKVAHFSHRIFTGYSQQASVELRTVFSNVLNDFLP